VRRGVDDFEVEPTARTVELAVHLADGIRASRARQGAGPGWAIADD